MYEPNNGLDAIKSYIDKKRIKEEQRNQAGETLAEFLARYKKKKR